MADLRRWALAALIVVGMLVLVLEPARIASWFRDDTSTGAAGTVEPTGGPVDDVRDDEGGPATTDWPTAPADGGRAVVRRVSDGDTIRLDVTAGRTGRDVRTRLLRIDAPELARDGHPDECGATAARDRLRALLPEGDEVVVAWDVEPTDQYGRDLVHVWTDDGTWVNGTLVAEGLAREVLFRPNDAHDDAIRSAEATARDRGLGLWTCQDRPGASTPGATASPAAQATAAGRPRAVEPLRRWRVR